MAASILVLVVLPIKRKISKPKTSNNLQLAEKIIFWFFIVDVLFLGYLGGMPIEWPFNIFSMIFCILYFLLIIAISSDLEHYSLRLGETWTEYFYRNFGTESKINDKNLISVLFNVYFLAIFAIVFNQII